MSSSDLRALSSYALDTIMRVDRSLPASWPEPVGYRVVVTGGRTITDLGYVWGALDTLHNLPPKLGGRGPILELGAGCARGVDELALRWAVHNDVPWRRYVADWDRYSEAAGALRNEAMLIDFEASELAIFDGGVGTTDCARKCRKLVEKKKLTTARVFLQRDLDPFEDALKWG